MRVRGLMSTDDIVWEHSAMAPDGRFEYAVLTRDNEQRLVETFGRPWLDKHLADTKSSMDSKFVQ